MVHANLESPGQTRAFGLLEKMSDELNNIANAFSSFDDTRAAIKEFLRNTPLYVKLKVALPNTVSKIYPDALLLDCPSCKAERPFRDERPSGSGAPAYTATGTMVPPAKAQSGVRYFVYRCTFCKTEVEYFVHLDYAKQQIHKVGQTPPLELPIDRQLGKKLGKEDEQLFRRAQMCISQSYGIGACAYLRRIVENKIDSLLELYREKRIAEGADATEITKINTVLKTIIFEDKVKLLRPELPTEIEVEGHNPVYLMYDRLSHGIHDLNDQECVAVAQEVSALLTEILVGLEEQKERARRYNEGIKTLAKQRTLKPPKE